MADTRLGVVTHFFNKISVAVILLEDDSLSLGETIKFVGRGKEFTQQIDSMQVEHEPIKKAKKGEEVAIKVIQPAKEGDEIFKVTP